MINQNSCLTPYILPPFVWPNHFFTCHVWHDSKASQKFRVGFCCTYLISSFCKFLGRCRPSQSLLGQGTEINKEGDSRSNRGWVQKPCHTVRWLCWASWHGPMFCKLCICTQIAFHRDTKRVGYWCCMWEVCVQILLSVNRITVHASWACFESLLLNLHIQPQASHFIAQQIKLLPNHF